MSDLENQEVEEKDPPPGDNGAEDNHEEDERLAGEHDEDDGNSGETEEEREAIRARRREERRQKKEAQRQREDSLRRELAARDSLINDMRNRLDAVERKAQSADLGQVDTALKQTAEEYNYYKNQIALAVTQNRGDVVAEATEKMIAAQRRAEQLANIKQAAQRGQQQPQPLDPRLQSHAQEWMGKNSWYRPDAADSDIDTRIALQVDDALAREGWQPTTKEYWDELDSRLKKYLPHRYQSGYNPEKRNQQQTNRSPVAGSGRDSAGGTAKGSSYTVSPERVAALKEAGLWNDPKKREAAIARFREYDKTQGAK